MTGGRGTRLWPLSTTNKPKQFVKIIGDSSLVEMTYRRMKKLFKEEDIYFLLPYDLVPVLRSLINVKEENIIPEPDTMDTAPALILGSYYLLKRGYSEVLSLPADHYIEEDNTFYKTLEKGISFASRGYIVTFGIKPHYPATGYGYIEPGEVVDKKSPKVFKVKRFIEKPDINRAKEYIKKNFLWNSGMFVWNMETIVEEFKKFLPNTLHVVKSMVEEKEFTIERYKNVDKISIDFAIMEKSKRILTIESNFKWDDLGSWWFLERYGMEGLDRNRFMGNLITVESKDNMAFSDSGYIVLYGVENLLVVKYEDKVLVMKKENINKMKELINILKEKNIY